MAGMVSGLDRKNCWTIAEHRGAATPDALQHLLARASWDADAVRDDLRNYVIDAFGDPVRSWWSTYAEPVTMPSRRWWSGECCWWAGCLVCAVGVGVGIVTGFPGR